MKSTFTVRDPNGQSHQIEGESSQLTLRDVFTQISAGRQGGERWEAGRLRVGGMEYSERDFGKTFQELGIQSGTTIEVLPL